MKPVHIFSLMNPRLRIFYGVFAALFICLGVGLFWRQIVLREEYQRREELQKKRRVLQPGPRGNIYDRHGDLLVGNRPRFSAVVYLNELRDEFSTEYVQLRKAFRAANDALPTDEQKRFDFSETLWQARHNVLKEYLDQINTILGRDDTLSRRHLENEFLHRLLLPFPLVSDLPQEEYARLIEQLPIGSPIQIYTDTVREYPHGDLASHTIGYVVPERGNPVDDTLPGSEFRTFSSRGHVGKSGLERQFDDRLQGVSGGEIWVVDRNQFRYERVASQKPRPGEDLTTSIDIALQKAAEDAIGERFAAAIAVSVKTGEILAMASKPDYDLNDMSPSMSQATVDLINARGAWLNRATQGLYPPGSTFKMITAIAAMKAGAVGPFEEIYCPSYHMVGRRRFPEHGGHTYGMVDLAKSLEKSSNVYYYQIGLKTGIDAIAHQAKRFGLDRPTGVEIPFEADGSVVPTKEWKRENRGYGWVPGDTANVSIGQGFLLVTPLQMARFAASLARRETNTRITLLKQDPRVTVDHQSKPIGLTDEQYGAIIAGMERVIGPSGTGRRAKVEGVRIAGKTGTAQIRSNGQPLTLAWFLGFAPIEDPEIAVVIMVQGVEADDNFAGGLTAAPIAHAIFDTYFKQRRIPRLASLDSLSPSVD